ncbi:MAG: VanW family protein [Armatimonadetes bacterium]|nr:VanW family protein [Armatimonadota bacterium]
MKALKSVIRKLVPFGVRVAWVRRRESRAYEVEHSGFVLPRAGASDFPIVIAEHRSPLRRPGTTYDETLQVGKETNVARAAKAIDGTVIEPRQVFSYHHTVGAPTQERGFVHGAELHDGDLKPGIGGGCCQVSNLLYVLSLLAGGEIVERHRHGFDLFPDSERTVPFGCGATIFFPHRDLRFRNLLDQKLMISLAIEDGFLVGRMRSDKPCHARYELFEMEGTIRECNGRWVRENRVGRRTIQPGTEPAVEEVAHNIATCLYDPRS